MDKASETIKQKTEELLNIMGFAAVAKIDGTHDDSVSVNIACDEGGILIGQGGENLLALQHIIRLLVFKELGEEAKKFVIDVNGYRQGKVEMLRDMALDRADMVAKERRSFSFSPMSSYERRIIHMALEGKNEIACESEGDGVERHIVIKPV
jgi:spoIIIJ-associated protein